MRLSRRQAWLLVGAAAWTWYVWTTRIWNILQDPAHSTAFKAVHGALAVVSLALLTPVGLIGIRALRALRGQETGHAAAPDAPKRVSARNP
jgi:hypothetical protein